MKSPMVSRNKSYQLLSLLSLLLLFSVELCAKQKIITLATGEFPPLVSENAINQGYLTAIVKEAYRRSGYEIKITFMPWKRALVSAKSGGHDGLLAAYFSEERDQFFTISDEVIHTEVVFVKLAKRDIFFTELNSLKSYVIGLVRGGSFPKIFREADYLTKEEVNTHEQNVEKLLLGRIDLIITQKRVIQSIMHSDFQGRTNEIEILSPPFSIQKAYAMISKKHPHSESLIDDFNKGLNSMKNDGTYQKLLQFK